MSEHGVDEDDDGVRVGAVGGEVRVEHEWLRAGCVRDGEGLDEFDEGEVANCFWRYCCWYLDRDRYLVIHNERFEFVSITWQRVMIRFRW